MTIEEKILNYAHLSPDERAEVDAYVDEHSEWGALLRNVRQVEAWAADIHALSDPTSDDVLALYVLAQRAHPDRIPTELVAVFERLEARLENDPAIQHRYEAAKQRLLDLDAALDPVAHFESLSGHSLSPDDSASTEAPADGASAASVAPDAPRRSANAPAPDAPPSARRSNDSSSSPASSPDSSSNSARADRSATPIYALPRAARWAVAALLVVAAGYGALFGVSQASQSPLLALAEMNIDQDVINSYPLRTRSVQPRTDAESADDLYLEALSLLNEARETTLGLFPTYNVEMLNEAESLLRRALDRTEPGSFLWGEASFYLGKVNLAQNNVGTARQVLQRVAQSDTRRSDEAYQILVRLQDIAPAPAPTRQAPPTQ